MREVDEDGFAIRPNKSEQKRQLAALQDLVLKLIDEPEKVQKQLVSDEQLITELKQARDMKANAARKRLVKHVTKLLSKTDTQPIHDYFDKEGLRQQQANRAFHLLEQWRDRMIDSGDSALQEFLEKYPSADRQQLRQAVRAAVKEHETGKPAGAGKKLFRLLRETSEEI